MTDELGGAAADYVAQTKDKPFFLYLAYNATHGPNEATEEDLASVKGGGGNEKHRAMTLAWSTLGWCESTSLYAW